MQAMRRAGLAPEVDERHRFARARMEPDIDLEVGFSSVFRVLGALIDTLWTGKRGEVGAGAAVLEYRFGRGEKARFIVRHGGERAAALAARLSGDREVRRLIRQAELKSIVVQDAPGGRRVQVQPMPGTITAMYFPPLPPYTVAIHPEEADAQLRLVHRLLQA